MNQSFKNISCTKNHVNTYTILGGQSQCDQRMSSYALFMTGMDHEITTLPRLQMRNKIISRLGQLPITLTGITHDHMDERYAQYSNELWPNDPNFIIRSLLRLLGTLEVALVS
jgi:hypothetical protein